MAFENERVFLEDRPERKAASADTVSALAAGPRPESWRQGTAGDRDRLSELDSYRILQSDREEAFNRLVRLGAQTFGSRICLISLVDDDRQWFKAAHGLAVRETKRSSAFCDHAIRDREPTVILDARSDPRVARNPLVTGWPHIRFYAGAPLITPRGYALGTFCVIDTEPRPDFDASERQALADFADMTMRELELRRALGPGYRDLTDDAGRARDLAGLQGMLEAVTQSGIDGMLVLDPSFRVVRSNAAADSLLDRSAGGVLTEDLRSVLERLAGPQGVSILDEAIRSAGRTGTPPRPQRLTLSHRSGADVAVDIAVSVWDRGDRSWYTVLLRDMRAAEAAQASMARALRKAKAAEEARGALMRMAGHELRTPLNQIRGFAEMMDLQLRGPLAEEYRSDVTAILTGADRLTTLVESVLLLADRSGREATRSEIDLPALISTLTDDLPEGAGFRWRIAVPRDLRLLADAGELDRMLRELTANARRFSSAPVTVTVEWRHLPDGRGVLTVQDDGPGMDRRTLAAARQAFAQADERLERAHDGMGLGLPVVDRLMAAHGGALHVASRPGLGTRARLVFPAHRIASRIDEVARSAAGPFVAVPPSVAATTHRPTEMAAE